MRIIELWINGAAVPVTTPSELRNHVEGAPGADVEFHLSVPSSGPILSVLVTGGSGWLMYLREPGDSGFHSWNAGYSGDETLQLPYRLANGQLDHYPARWTLPLPLIFEAVDEFSTDSEPPASVEWRES